ncbi:hypothetical protein DICA3_C01002 [Diutina catenulata]
MLRTLALAVFAAAVAAESSAEALVVPTNADEVAAALTETPYLTMSPEAFSSYLVSNGDFPSASIPAQVALYSSMYDQYSGSIPWGNYYTTTIGTDVVAAASASDISAAASSAAVAESAASSAESDKESAASELSSATAEASSELASVTKSASSALASATDADESSSVKSEASKAESSAKSKASSAKESASSAASSADDSKSGNDAAVAGAGSAAVAAMIMALF